MRSWSSRRRAGVVGCLLTLLSSGGCSKEEEPAKTAMPSGPAPAVVVADVRQETVLLTQEFVARTEAVETVEVVARVEAVLEAREFEEGEPVTRGQVLYRLDSRTYDANLAAAKAQQGQAEADLKLAREQVSVRAAEAALAQSRAKLRKAEQDVARLRPLAEKDAVPRQDLDTAVAAEEVAQEEVNAQEATLDNAKIQEQVGILLAEAQVQAAQASVDLAELNLEYCTITAPIDGLIGRTEVTTGNLVGRGAATTLATISSIDPIYVTFAVSEAEYLDYQSRLRDGRQKESPAIDLVLADDSVYGQQGTIVTADRAVSTETGTLQIVARFANPAGQLRPGQFGRVRFVTRRLEDALLLPQRAVMEQQSAKVVFVVDDSGMVALRTIQVVDRHGEDFVVAAGVEAGDRVIVEGQLKARPGSKVQPTTKPISSEPGRAAEARGN